MRREDKGKTQEVLWTDPDPHENRSSTQIGVKDGAEKSREHLGKLHHLCGGLAEYRRIGAAPNIIVD